MTSRRPPLNALRAFEAAARHRNLTRAAEELGVTQGAVSRQVKSLEGFLGTGLFRRGPSSLALTDSGRAIAPTLTQALQSIDRCLEEVRADRTVLRLQVAPTFAIRWLLPRLKAFTDRQPRIDVRVTITLHPETFDPRSFDAGIVYGDGLWPELAVTRLSEECLAPVCAPSVQNSDHPIRELRDLGHHVLLHTTTDRRDWPLWLKVVGAVSLPAREGPAFETLDLAVRAAEAGHGIALGDLSLIAEDIHDGRLLLPLGPPVYSGRGLFFLCPAETAGKDSVRTFREWLVSVSPLVSGPEKPFV